MRNKLALGTVQFGLNYGIKNINGQVPITEVINILHLAKKENISVIDTAQAYGNSEGILGDIGVEDFNVITKFVVPKNGSSLADTVLLSLKRLKLQRLYGILFHHFNCWESQPEIWIELQKIKNEGYIQKIGFSLYHPSQWLFLKEKGIMPDLLQIPMNLLNQQFTPYLSDFKKAGIEVHVRSAFLQGLLLLDVGNLPREFLEITTQIKALKRISENLNVSKANICLLWLWQNHYVDYIVVGVDNISQWIENLSSAKWCEKNSDEIKIDAAPFVCENEDIINPSKWKIA